MKLVNLFAHQLSLQHDICPSPLANDIFQYIVFTFFKFLMAYTTIGDSFVEAEKILYNPIAPNGVLNTVWRRGKVKTNSRSV